MQGNGHKREQNYMMQGMALGMCFGMAAGAVIGTIVHKGK